MAVSVRIPSTNGLAKIRGVVAVGLLAFVTLYIHTAFWWYFINRELRDLGRSRNSNQLGDAPGMSLLAVTLGVFLIVPPILSTINTFKRIKTAQELVLGRASINGWMLLILLLVLAPAGFAYMQSELNQVWVAMEDSPQMTQPVATGQISSSPEAVQSPATGSEVSPAVPPSFTPPTPG